MATKKTYKDFFSDCLDGTNSRIRPFGNSLVPKKRSLGIYSIINRNSGKVYIGSAVDLQCRFFTHKKRLNDKKHHNRHLQSAYDKNPLNFEFSVIEELKDKNHLVPREQFWMDFYKSYQPKIGYNLTLKAGSCLGIKKAYKPRSEEFRISQSIRMKGFKLSEESRRKISKALTGRKATPNQLKNLSFGWGIRKGVKLSEEIKSKMAKTRKELKSNCKAVIQTDINGTKINKFDSMIDAANFLGGSLSKRVGISMCCLGKLKSSSGFKWKYA